MTRRFKGIISDGIIDERETRQISDLPKLSDEDDHSKQLSLNRGQLCLLYVTNSYLTNSCLSTLRGHPLN